MRCRDTSSHDGETAQVSLLFPLFIMLLTVKEGDRSSVYYTGSDFAVYSSLLTATHCFAITNNASSSLARPSSTAGSRRCDCMDKHSLPIKITLILTHWTLRVGLEMRLYWLYMEVKIARLVLQEWEYGDANALMGMEGNENSTFSHLLPISSWSSDIVNGPLFFA